MYILLNLGMRQYRLRSPAWLSFPWQGEVFPPNLLAALTFARFFSPTWPDTAAPRLRLHVAEYTDIEIFNGEVGVTGEGTTLTIDVPLLDGESFGVWEMALSARTGGTVNARLGRLNRIFGIKCSCPGT